MMRNQGVLLAGATPGSAAGLSVMTGTLLGAVSRVEHVTLLTHEISPFPYARWNGSPSVPVLALGVQPVCVHGEAILAGRLHRSEVKGFTCGWAVGSRHAEALRSAGIPYLIWEATTLRDELATTGVSAVRRSHRGTGAGTVLHKTLLPLNEWLEGRLYRRAVGVLALSEYTADRIRTIHGLDQDRLRVLHPPASSAFHTGLERARANGVPHARSVEAASNQHPIRLLFVGRVDDPRKNFDLLCAALRRLETEATPTKLTVVGPHNDDWRRSLGLDGYSQIRFIGSVDQLELGQVLLDQDALVVSSRQEGFGIVIVEAMHAGLPVIATRCGGPEHVLQESGAGLLVDHTAQALAAAIRQLATDGAMRSAMGHRARDYADRELSPTRFYRRVEEELERLREATRRRPGSP